MLFITTIGMGTFTDVTEAAGVAGATFGMGVAVGDYNNDGYPDMFVTACGRALLYRNNRDGTFTNVTKQAGIEISGWTTSAVWFDFDNDGRLDLFVCSFVRYFRKTAALAAAMRRGRNITASREHFIRQLAIFSATMETERLRK